MWSSSYNINFLINDFIDWIWCLVIKTFVFILAALTALRINYRDVLNCTESNSYLLFVGSNVEFCKIAHWIYILNLYLSVMVNWGLWFKRFCLFRLILVLISQFVTLYFHVLLKNYISHHFLVWSSPVQLELYCFIGVFDLVFIKYRNIWDL